MALTAGDGASAPELADQRAWAAGPKGSDRAVAGGSRAATGSLGHQGSPQQPAAAALEASLPNAEDPSATSAGSPRSCRSDGVSGAAGSSRDRDGWMAGPAPVVAPQRPGASRWRRSAAAGGELQPLVQSWYGTTAAVQLGARSFRRATAPSAGLRETPAPPQPRGAADHTPGQPNSKDASPAAATGHAAIGATTSRASTTRTMAAAAT